MYMKLYLTFSIAFSLLFSGIISGQDISDLNDEFNDPSTLNNWSRYSQTEGWPDRLLNIDINTTEPGALFLEPSSSGWFNDLDSPFIFKLVEGDFIVTTRIKATGNNSNTPERLYSLTGIFIREPRDITPETWVAGQENWMFISTGAGDVAGVPKFEVKNTVESDSELELFPADTGWVELRLERLNDIYTVEYKFPDSEWEQLRVYDETERPIMSDTLQVGIVAYTDWPSISQYVNDPFTFKNMVVNGNPDLRSYVDYFRFSRRVTTSIENEELKKGSFQLNQNYPNPFNPVTNIAYSLSSSGEVEIAVYNIYGQKMTTLEKTYKTTGQYNSVFNARSLPSGVYFYQLKLNGKPIATKKMTLLK